MFHRTAMQHITIKNVPTTIISVIRFTYKSDSSFSVRSRKTVFSFVLKSRSRKQKAIYRKHQPPRLPKHPPRPLLLLEALDPHENRDPENGLDPRLDLGLTRLGGLCQGRGGAVGGGGLKRIDVSSPLMAKS